MRENAILKIAQFTQIITEKRRNKGTDDILSWPKIFFRFFYNIFWASELFSQHRRWSKWNKWQGNKKWWT